MDLKNKYTQIIKEKSNKYGFISCGISKIKRLNDQEKNLEDWLIQNNNGTMKYMENHFEIRLNPKLLLEDAKTIISFSYNYFPDKIQKKDTYKIAKYSYGKDYHFVIKNKLQSLIEELKQEIGDFSFRVFVDSAPILEKVWANKSGLGWIGKNSNLITQKVGSFYFLAEIICDLDLEEDFPAKDFCGTCTKCIDSCPTQAIYEPKKVDAKKCISYATIELKDNIPDLFKDKMNDWIFGCDICQDVCPWNRFSKPNLESQFTANQKILEYNKNDWEELTEDIFKEIFRKSAVKRTKFIGLKRNINFID